MAKRAEQPVAAPPPLPVTTAPMEAHIAGELPEGAEWQFEPKWDGFRCLAFRCGDGSICEPNPASRSAAIFLRSSRR